MIREREKKHTEYEIVEGIRNNNETIVASLINILKPKVFHWIRTNSGTQEDAKDIFEQTWEAVLINIKTGKYKEGNFEAYFKAISRNIWLKKIPDSQKTGALNNEMKDFSQEELNTKIEKDNNCNIVHQNFMQLDKKCREILTLKYIKGIKMKDIASQLDTSENFVKVKLFRCKQRLLDLLEDDPGFTIK